MKLLSLLLLAVSLRAQEPPKAADCDFHAPAVKGIMSRASLQNRLRPGGWAHWKAADGGDIVCVYKDKYLKIPAVLKSVDAGGDDLVFNDVDGGSQRVLQSKMLLANGFSREQDAADSAWFVSAKTHGSRALSFKPAKYGDAPEDQSAAEDKALELFLAEDGTDGFRGEGQKARKRRACLKSWMDDHLKGGVTLYPAGSPADRGTFADAPGAKGGGRVVEVGGELMVKTGADDFRPCP